MGRTRKITEYREFIPSEIIKGKKRDLKFIEEIEKDKRNTRRGLFLCQCGKCVKPIIVRYSNIKNTINKNCRKNFIKLTYKIGEIQENGFLTILRKVSRKELEEKNLDVFKHRGQIIECSCNCKDEQCLNICYVMLSSFISGVTSSCGSKSKPYGNPWMAIANKLIWDASRRKIPCNLSTEQIIEYINGKCHYCNNDPSNICAISKMVRNGIDRKDNSIGYTADNCVSCCWECNNKKSSTNYEDFLKWIEKIYHNRINPPLLKFSANY